MDKDLLKISVKTPHTDTYVGLSAFDTVCLVAVALAGSALIAKICR